MIPRSGNIIVDNQEDEENQENTDKHRELKEYIQSLTDCETI